MTPRADVFDIVTRSAVMRAVKSRDTTPERVVRAAVCALGYARHYRIGGRLAGKPDLVFSRKRRAIFVHGCFWHGHDCKRGARAPKDNAAYWRAKIAANQARDRGVLKTLKQEGWKTLIVWECETRDGAKLSAKLARFLG